MKRKINNEFFTEILLVIGILGYMAAIFAVNLLRFNYRINSDLASDAILGKLIWDSKEIVPDTWYLATEVRLICTPNIAALFYGMTGNMILSEGLACCTMTIMILFSVCYFSKTIEISRRSCLLFCFLSLIIPAGFSSLELLYLFASYYAIHVVILFVTLGIYIDALKNNQIKWIKTVISIAFALVLGIQGFRGILVIYGPLFGMECIRQLYNIYCKKKKKLRVSVWTLSLLVISFIGTCFPLSVGQDMSRNIRKGFKKLIWEVLPDFYKIIGFEEVNIVGKICLIIFCGVSIGILADILWRMYKRKEISLMEWGYLVLCSSPIVTAIIVAFTTVQSSERYYFLIVFIMAYAVLLIWQKINQRIRVLFAIMIAVYATVIGYNVYLPALESEEPPKTDAYEVVKYLMDNDYQLSYSTFDFANMMTVLANGKVRVAAVASTEKMNICKWMSSTQWYPPNVPYEAKTAYIISENRLEEYNLFLKIHENDICMKEKIGNFYIYASDFNFSNLED